MGSRLHGGQVELSSPLGDANKFTLLAQNTFDQDPFAKQVSNPNDPEPVRLSPVAKVPLLIVKAKPFHVGMAR